MPRSGNPLSKLYSSAFSSSSRNPQPPPPSPPPLPPPQPPPSVFFCPISSLLMANPVVVPSGHTFDRPCIQACIDLNFIPPHLNLNLILPPPPSSFPLIPNLNLYHAILQWCQHSGHPLPTPITSECGSHFVRGLMSMPTPPPPLDPPPLDPPPYPSIDPEKEQWILESLKKPKRSSRESAMAALLDTPLCSPRILAAVIPFLTNPGGSTLHTLTAQAVYRLSQDPANRIHILRSGAVPPLISVLYTGISSAGAAAAGTFYKFAVDERYRLAIGALGAVPALLEKFCEYFLIHAGRLEAALALYHLSLCPANLEVLIENQGVGRLLEAATDRMSPTERRSNALILLHCLVGVERGREEVLDENGGGMGVLLGMVKDERGGLRLGTLAVMYTVCRGSMGRFQEAARAAGVEEVLMEKMVEFGDIGQEMAWGMVRVMRGECGEGEMLREVVVEFEQGPLEEEEEVREEEEEEEEGGGAEDKKGKKKMVKKLKERIREIVRMKRGESSGE